MEKVLLFLIVTFLSPFAGAADLVDQQQTSGGEEYRFAYSNQTNGISQKLAKQSFVPQQANLKRVDLRIYANYANDPPGDTADDPLRPPCTWSDERFDLFIEDNYGSQLASLTNIPICGLYSEYAVKQQGYWNSFNISTTLTPGAKYWIKIWYTGSSLCYDSTCRRVTLGWLRSTSDAYSVGESFTNYGTVSKDFTFKTYYDSNLCPDGSPRDSVGDPCNHNDCADFSAKDGSGDPCNHNDCPNGSLQDPIGDPCNHDEDADGTPDTSDACPFSAVKSASVGVCGCDTPDLDADGDTVLGCNDCNDNDAAIYPGHAENCDSKDNDCDGTTDEGCGCLDGTTQACGTGIGECAQGLQTCSGGLWGDCQGSVGPVSEICDGNDNDCDGATDEGGVCDTVTHCGSYGNSCASGQVCQNGQCTDTAQPFDYGQLEGKTVLLPWSLFLPVVAELKNQGMVNQLFYTDLSETEASRTFLGGIAWWAAESASTLFSYVMLEPWQYKVLLDHEILKNALVGQETVLFIQNADGIDDVVYLANPQSQLAVANANKLITRTDRWISTGALAKLDAGIAGLFALYYAGTESEGDPSRFAVLAPTYYGVYSLPHMIVLGVVKIGKDIVGTVGDLAWGVIGVDPEEFACELTDPFWLTSAEAYAECGLAAASGIWNTLTDAIDLLLDPQLISNGFYGECGLLNGKISGCVETLGEGLQLLTHPFPFIEQIDVSQSGNRLTFRERVKDQNVVQALSNEIWIGGTVMSEETLGCNYDLPPQRVSFSQGQEREVVFDYTFPDTFPRNREFPFVSKLWYNCIDCSQCWDSYECFLCNTNFLGYQQCNPGQNNRYYCYGDELEQLNLSLTGAAADFILQNAPPILNDVRCDAPAILGVSCPAMVRLNAGDRLVVTAYANDPDSNNVDLNTTGDIGFVKSCRRADGYDQICTFTLETSGSLAGDHWFKVNAYDGYDLVSRQFSLTVAPPPSPPPPPSSSGDSSQPPSSSGDSSSGETPTTDPPGNSPGGCNLIIF